MIITVLSDSRAAGVFLKEEEDSESGCRVSSSCTLFCR